MSRHLVEKVEAGAMTLSSDAAHHLLHVLRAKVGQSIVLFDAGGRQAQAKITKIEKGSLTVEVGPPEIVDKESSLSITLAFALSKGGKPEWIVQKAVELGVNRIIIFVADRSVAKWSLEDAPRKMARMESVAAGAAAQCGRNILPKLDFSGDLSGAIALMAKHPLRIALHTETDYPLSAYFTDGAPERVGLLCGPEGGLSPQEVNTLQAYDWRLAGMGPRTLRAETAALAAVTLVQGMVGDLGGRK